MRRAAALLVLAAALPGCSRGVRVFVEEPYPAKLSAWRLFDGRMAELKPAARVVPYDLNTPLFSDYADKFRTVWMPQDTAAEYHPTDTFTFPTGTIFSKTFSYNRKHVETRLLVKSNNGWVGLPYVWNEQQTEAVLQVAGDSRDISWKHAGGETLAIDYLIPNVNQCKGCHDNAKVTLPIGPKARHLNRDYDYPEGRRNQLDYWTEAGYLKGAPASGQAPRLAGQTLAERARAYLEINCAHCHGPGGPGNTSGLDLRASVTDLAQAGACKTPVATGVGSGGLLYSIVPGRPDESILVFRMESTALDVMMPELGRSVVHREGVALVREWVASLIGECPSRDKM